MHSRVHKINTCTIRYWFFASLNWLKDGTYTKKSAILLLFLVKQHQGKLGVIRYPFPFFEPNSISLRSSKNRDSIAFMYSATKLMM